MKIDSDWCCCLCSRASWSADAYSSRSTAARYPEGCDAADFWLRVGLSWIPMSERVRLDE
jgi:hypothetical protein